MYDSMEGIGGSLLYGDYAQDVVSQHELDIIRFQESLGILVEGMPIFWINNLMCVSTPRCQLDVRYDQLTWHSCVTPSCVASSCKPRSVPRCQEMLIVFRGFQSLHLLRSCT